MSRGLQGRRFVGGRCEAENPDNRQCHQRRAGHDAVLHGVSSVESLAPGNRGSLHSDRVAIENHGGTAGHCAAEAEPIGLPRIVMPSGSGRPATLKLAATSSSRRRR